MWKKRWLLALPLALAVTIGSAHAASIRDHAGMFSAEAVREAEAKLNQIERETGITATIETIDSLEGRPVSEVAIAHARRTETEGIFILISKQEHKIRVLVSRPYARALPRSREEAIEAAFVSHFKKGDFDGGLRDGVETIAREIAAAQSEKGGLLRRAEAPPAGPIRGRPVARPAAHGFGLGSLLGIGLLILAVLIGVRLIGSLFRGGQGAYGPGMGRPGMGPGGYGPGGPGYGGGGGGGFLSSLFGGIGGAMAGNWLYDQFSGRHAGGTYADNTASTPGADPNQATTGGDDWSGGTGVTGDWGGGDAGGDAGGGGDWGGGGGDWGGGGGGDWGGGGGGDGGSW